MADLKISQLPAATTPLAGTEVLPIVQSGTTKQVSVDNVLLNRAILGANTFTAAQEWATGTAIASAATINLDTATGNRVHITGTTTITAVTLTRGPRTVIFDGVLTLTHNATTNNLPSAANITTAAGDRAIYESDGTTVYCISYNRANGRALSNPIATSTVAGLVPTPPNNTTTFLRGDATFAVPAASGFTLGTPVATTSGTSIDFTGIPAGTKQIIITFKGVSTDGTSNKAIQIGDAGGIETADYASVSHSFVAATVSVTTSTSLFIIKSALDADLISGSVSLTLENSTANSWAITGVLGAPGGNSTFTVSGAKSLSATLDRVRITTVNGSDNFDAGEINIAYL